MGYKSYQHRWRYFAKTFISRPLIEWCMFLPAPFCYFSLSYVTLNELYCSYTSITLLYTNWFLRHNSLFTGDNRQYKMSCRIEINQEVLGLA